MRRHRLTRFLGLVLAGALLGSCTGEPAPATTETSPASPGPQFESVAPGVWAYVQPSDERFNDSNGVLILTGEDLVLIDAPARSATVGILLEGVAALEEQTGLHLTTLVNTHWHSDHTQGNAQVQAAHPQVAIRGHVSLAEDIRERVAQYNRETIERLEQVLPRAQAQLEKGQGMSGQTLDEEQLAAQERSIEAARVQLEELRAVQLVMPNEPNDAPVSLRRSSGEIRLLPFVAHTRGDTVVYLPGQKVLITGDLLDDLPYAGHGYPRSWLRALESLAELEFDVIVPGHGPVFRGRSALERQLGLFRAAIAGVDECLEQGVTLEACQARTDLASHKQAFVGEDPVALRTWESFLPDLIASAFRELEETDPSGPEQQSSE